MVCKINFDYEILLSDSNENDYSTESDENDESFNNRKFRLGDNISCRYPIEIISVGRLREEKRDIEELEELEELGEEANGGFVFWRAVPANVGVCYDESVGDLEDESVRDDWSEGETEWRDSVQYELPVVARYATGDARVGDTSRSAPVTEFGHACVEERLRRMRGDASTSLCCSIGVSSSSNNPSRTSANIPVTDSPSTNTSDSIPSDISNLSIDLLTQFINGDKSLNDILKEKIKKETPSKKRKKTSHKSKQKSKPKINKIDSSNRQHSSPPQSSTTPINYDESIDNHLSSNDQIIPVESPPQINNNHYCDSTENTGDNRYATRSDPIIDTGDQRTESTDSGYNDVINPIPPLSLTIDTSVVTVAAEEELESLAQDQDKLESINQDQDKIESLDQNQDKLESLDQDQIKVESLDPDQDKHKSLDHCHHVSDLQSINSPEKSIINQFIDLSLFKFNFLNESHLIADRHTEGHSQARINTNNSTSDHRESIDLSTQSNIDLAESDPIEMIDESNIDSTSGSIPNTVIDTNGGNDPRSIESSEMIDKEDRKSIITMDKEVTEMKSTMIDFGDAKENTYQSTIDTSTDKDNQIRSIESMTDENKAHGTESDGGRVTDTGQAVSRQSGNDGRQGGCKYNPFKRDYDSRECVVSSQQEMCQFLHYQWLRFCERYTLFQHRSSSL